MILVKSGMRLREEGSGRADCRCVDDCRIGAGDHDDVIVYDNRHDVEYGQTKYDT